MNFKARIQQQFSRAAKVYDQAAALQYECCQELALSLPPLDIRRALDLGTGTGYGLQILQKKYPEAHCYGLDLSHSMLLQARFKSPNPLINADFDALPFADQRFNLIFSNLALQWSPDLRLSLNEAQRVLKPGGTLLFSTLLDGSLRELNATHFLEKSAILSQLTQAGFEPIADFAETRTLYFASIKTALLSLKKIGANASCKAQYQGLNARARLQELIANYPKTNSSYPLSYELLFIAARKIS